MLYPERRAKIPRNDVGFAVNKHHVKEDEERAKDIKLFVLGRAAEMLIHGPDQTHCQHLLH
jgi:hypothetical protein